MTFEEEFPSLKGKEQYTGVKGELDFTKEDVSKYCLDKQKVKAFFEKHSTKPKWECQDMRRQQENRNRRQAFREVWQAFEEELGL